MSDSDCEYITNPKKDKVKENDGISSYGSIVVSDLTRHGNSVDNISYANAFKTVVCNSVPCIIGLVFELSVEVVNMIYIGQTGDEDALGGVGLGNMLVNIV
jgi:Na+-driven multidrug efflux pump